jgi:hypothetical protein
MAISTKSILNPFQRPTTILLVFGLLVFGTIGVKGRVWRSPATVPNSPQQLLPIDRGPAQIVNFTIYEEGIFPRETRASAGIVVLHMDDMSGVSAGLVVVRESQETLLPVVRSFGQSRGNRRIALGAGRYTVYDASQPLNRATLIIDPQ